VVNIVASCHDGRSPRAATHPQFRATRRARIRSRPCECLGTYYRFIAAPPRRTGSDRRLRRRKPPRLSPSRAGRGRPGCCGRRDGDEEAM